MKNRKSIVYLVGGLVMTGWLAPAATILAVSGPNDASTTFDVLSNHLAVGFSLSTEHTNVDIIATLAAFDPGGNWNLTAYLTTQIGPGTTAANEIASSSSVITLAGSQVTAPYTFSPQTIFSGLSLGPGNYYLLLSGTFSTTNAWWVSSASSGLTTTGSGAATVLAPYLYGAGAPDPYLPAGNFTSGSGAAFGFWFSISGEAVESVPDPGTAVFALPGFVLIWLLRRRLED